MRLTTTNFSTGVLPRYASLVTMRLTLVALHSPGRADLDHPARDGAEREPLRRQLVDDDDVLGAIAVRQRRPYLVADLHVAVRRDRERPVAVELRPLAASLEDLVDRLVLLAASEQAVLQVVHVRLVGGVEVPVGRYDQGAGNLEELAHDPLVLGVAASEPLHVNAENAVPFPFSELAEHLLDFRSRVYRLGRDDLAVPLLDADSVADRKLDDPGFVLAQGLLDGHHVAALVAVVAGLAQDTRSSDRSGLYVFSC